MADYKKMYSILFNEMTKAIDILQQAQIKTEEMFISADDTPVPMSVITEIAKQKKK
ncbi:MAG: hypothetical protein IJC83_05915 [Oscillospiraceae bacterium]|nr:hypothetical protein [Oscillospiraceae bacterium]